MDNWEQRVAAIVAAAKDSVGDANTLSRVLVAMGVNGGRQLHQNTITGWCRGESMPRADAILACALIARYDIDAGGFLVKPARGGQPAKRITQILTPGRLEPARAEGVG